MTKLTLEEMDEKRHELVEEFKEEMYISLSEAVEESNAIKRAVMLNDFIEDFAEEFDNLVKETIETFNNLDEIKHKSGRYPWGKTNSEGEA